MDNDLQSISEAIAAASELNRQELDSEVQGLLEAFDVVQRASPKAIVRCAEGLAHDKSVEYSLTILAKLGQLISVFAIERQD